VLRGLEFGSKSLKSISVVGVIGFNDLEYMHEFMPNNCSELVAPSPLAVRVERDRERDLVLS
jgi:hypothetical protein